MARKENSNSIASRLSRIELDEGTAYDLVRERLGVENMDYADAVEWIEETFELETSVGALVNFYRKHCTGFKAKRNREYAREIRDMFEKDPEINFSELTLQQIEQRAFEEAYAKDADIKDLQALSSILGDSARLKLQQRRLELDVNKWRDAVKSDIEKGLDALQDEIKGNAEALKLFDQMKALFIQSVEGAEA
ncbi:MAG: hypothetical protein CML13_15820 [Puniceicoccaceae bacterium]|nr:hypothetical protein [Puniceicoccaceae bacterium]|tara:strand:- start:8048 stop:8626 length:579 start_codon:yes stop_codon:yes gene_type:complete